MKKIKCLLVDDEPLAIQLLQKHLEQLDGFEVTASCPNAIRALEVLNGKEIDLLFLDIKMPKVTGIELLKTLRHPPKTIITTAWREYAIDGYDLDIVDYLLKPITFERFFKSIERYLRISRQSVPGITLPAETPSIYIKSGNKYHRVETSDILYIESLKDYIKIYAKGREIVSKNRISDLEKELLGRGFLRIHRSFIVNTKNITAFTATDIELGRIELPIGASYKEYVFKALKT